MRSSTHHSNAPGRIALTIAGFDPSSGAGITADLAVFAAHGLFGTSAITALTVQSTVGVREVQPVDAGLLRRTLDYLHADLPAAGIKIGMLAGAAQVMAVAEFIRQARQQQPKLPVVLDPVLRSSSGKDLLDEAGTRALIEHLLPLVAVVTPNTLELQLLAEQPELSTENCIVATARALQQRAPGLNVLVTGGHRESPDDLLVLPGETHLFTGSRIETRATHGTGCALSSAVLANLVQGEGLVRSVNAAKQYVRRAMETATPLGSGHGPMNHLWPRPFCPESGQEGN